MLHNAMEFFLFYQLYGYPNHYVKINVCKMNIITKILTIEVMLPHFYQLPKEMITTNQEINYIICICMITYCSLQRCSSISISAGKEAPRSTKAKLSIDIHRNKDQLLYARCISIIIQSIDNSPPV